MSSKVGIYLDSNAGAPFHPAALKAVLPLLQECGFPTANPSSIHSHGRQAKRALANAREQIAASLGPQVDSEQLIFTSSGTEANQLAIRSILEPLLLNPSPEGAPHWITTPVEHDSVRQMIPWFQKRGGKVSLLPVDSQGAPQVEELTGMIRSTTALVSVVWVNNETGVITPIERLSAILKSERQSALLHVDAAQAWGKIPIRVDALGAHLVSFSGHKIGALAGTGVLWMARGIRAGEVILGKQEKGRRGGTENLLGLVALGAAANQLAPVEWAQRMELQRDFLCKLISERIPGMTLNGGLAPRVANTLNISFDRVEGDGLVMALDLAGYSVSSGSACSSGVLEPSHVLMAMGKTPKQAMAALRISMSDVLPRGVLEDFVLALEKVVSRIRKSS